MLKVPDRRARNLLDLANLIEGLDPDDFNMKIWDDCICGHYLKSKGCYRSDMWQYAAQLLGLSTKQAFMLFRVGNDSPGSVEHDLIMLDTPRQAAERIRKFAFTLVD